MYSSVITLGTFDGVHLGHRALLRRVVQRAKACKAKAVALAFRMPPRHSHEADTKAFLITTLKEKNALMKSIGIHSMPILTFDRRTAATSPADFFKNTIVRRFHSTEMVVGPRVAFGKDRAGRLPLLRQLGAEADVRIHVIEAIGKGANQISSRRIRALLEKGNVEKAQQLLGYPYSAEGPVVHGDRRGRRLGYPTANVAVDPEKILPPGVFWVKVVPGSSYPLTQTVLNQSADGLCNVGTRPTFAPGERELRCEVYLLKSSKTLYGRRLRVVFLRKIRSEMRFKSSEQLSRHIAKDLSVARRWIAEPGGISLQNDARSAIILPGNHNALNKRNQKDNDREI